MCHGVKPLPHSNTFDTLSISREHKIINYCGRYFIVLGVKLALARIAAKEVVEMLCQDFGCKSINLMRTMTLVSLNMPKNPYILSAEKMKKEQMLIENACMEKRYGPGGILFLPAYEKELYQKLNEF